jgi:hypothetical protein
VDDPEVDVLEACVEELSATAPPERQQHIVRLREKMLALKLQRRMPRPSPRPSLLQNEWLWRLLYLALFVLAALLGLDSSRLPKP